MGNLPDANSAYVEKEGTYLFIKAPKIISQSKARFEWKFLKRDLSSRPTGSREFVTSKGDLLILSLDSRSHGNRRPILYVSVKFFPTKKFRYGTISINGKCSDH